MRLSNCCFPVVTLLMCVAICAHAQDGKPSNRVFLWEVKSDTATVYLMGSVHVGKRDFYPLDDRIQKAYEASDKLVVEANLAGPAALTAGVLMLERAQYPENDSLKANVSAETYEKVIKHMTKIGLPLDPNRFKPWFLSMMISLAELTKLGYQAQYGMDMHFLQRATGKKEIVELESADFQIKLLDSFGKQEQEIMLRDNLKESDELEKFIGATVTALKSGDAAMLDNLLTESIRQNPELKAVHKRIMDDRNIEMAKKIEELLKTSLTYFAVIGAGHLVGEQGLVKLLSTKYKVTQL